MDYSQNFKNTVIGDTIHADKSLYLNCGPSINKKSIKRV